LHDRQRTVSPSLVYTSSAVVTDALPVNEQWRLPSSLLAETEDIRV